MDELVAVYSRACKAVETGDNAGALQDFLWIHENPMHAVPASEGVRRAFSFFAWASLAKVYPPALEKLRASLFAKLAHLNHHPDDPHLNADVRALRQALKSVDGFTLV
jgi:hypothetical protein